MFHAGRNGHRRRFFALIFLVGLLVGASARAGDDWSGKWDSRWRGGGATLELTQTGDRVTGTYALYNGRIEAKVVGGRRLKGEWIESQKVERRGKFEFTLSPDGDSFAGMFESGEWWNGTRIVAPRTSQFLQAQVNSPRDTLKSFLIAAELNRAGQYDHLGAMIACIDFGPGGADLIMGQKGALAELLFNTLDQCTLRIWDLPGTEEKQQIKIPFRQAGTNIQFELEFIKDGSGNWRIVLPEKAKLEKQLQDFLTARGQDRLDATGQSLASPRQTMRAFIAALRGSGPGAAAQAAACLDLSAIPEEVRGIETPIVMDALVQVLDRVSYIILQEIPDDPKMPQPYIHFEHPLGNISIGPTLRGTERVWLFTRESVASARTLYEAMESAPIRGTLSANMSRAQFFSMRDRVRNTAPWLTHRILSVENWQWLGLIVLLLLGLFMGIGLTRVVIHLIRARFFGGELVLSKRVRYRVIWPLRLMFLGIIIYGGVALLGLPEEMLRGVHLIASLLLGAGITLSVYTSIDIVADFYRRRASGTRTKTQQEMLILIATSATKMIVIAGGAIIIADLMAIPYRSLLAGIGIGGLAIGLAAQDTLKSYLGSLSFVADPPFHVGDSVRFGTTEGEVETVGLRTIKIRGADNSQIIVPNSQIVNQTLVNLGRRRFRRTHCHLGVEYSTTPEQLEAFCEGVRELIRSHPHTRKEFFHVFVDQFGASSIDILLNFFLETTDTETELRERHKIFLDIMRLAAKLKVNFAFPTQTIHFEGETTVAPGQKEAERIMREHMQLGGDRPVLRSVRPHEEEKTQ
jgi:MscS family membrane protein